MGLERLLRGVVVAELATAGIGLTYSAATAPGYAQPPIPHVHRAATGPVLLPVTASVTVPRSPPVRISVPALGIDMALGPARGLNALGSIDDAPLSGPDWSLPWWYDGGAAPGQAGSAVLLGHVDSAVGAGQFGAFFRLGGAEPGDRIDVRLDDGRLTTWKVVSALLYRDATFPDAVVYGRGGSPTLRLVTCGGAFDWRTHHYTSSVVVTAVEASG